MARLRLLTLGTARGSRGGVAIIAGIIANHLPDETWQVSHIATHRDGPALAKLKTYACGWLQFLTQLPSADAVLLHLSAHGSCYRKLPMLTLLRLLGKPYSVYAHSGYFENFYKQSPSPLKAWIRWTLRGAQNILTVSGHWQQFYARLTGLPSRVSILRHPVSIPQDAPEPDEPITMLYLGRLDDKKGAYRAIRAAAKLARKPNLPFFRIVMGGDGEVEQARQLALQEGLADRAVFPGWLDEAARNTWLSDAHIYLLPTAFEAGLPLSVLEAMAHGLAVVTSPVTGIPEVIRHGENGLLVEVGDEPGLTTQLEALLKDVKLRQKLGRAARATAAEFALPHYLQTLRTLLLPTVRG
ncbi:glycosyltransferase [bacterium]|nr:glycosyltransferase [bacterium]